MRAGLVLLALLLAGCAADAPAQEAPEADAGAPPGGPAGRAVDVRAESLALAAREGTIAAFVTVPADAWAPPPPPYGPLLEHAATFHGQWGAGGNGSMAALLVYLVDGTSATLEHDAVLLGGMTGRFYFGVSLEGAPRETRLLVVLADDGAEGAWLRLSAKPGDDLEAVTPPGLVRAGAPRLARYSLTPEDTLAYGVEVDDRRENLTGGLRRGALTVRAEEARGPGLVVVRASASASGHGQARAEALVDGRAHGDTAAVGGAPSRPILGAGLNADAAFRGSAGATLALDLTAGADEGLELTFVAVPLDAAALGIRVEPRLPSDQVPVRAGPDAPPRSFI